MDQFQLSTKGACQDMSTMKNRDWQAPEARWEDGDLHCGVRGVADFRPQVAFNFCLVEFGDPKTRVWQASCGPQLFGFIGTYFGDVPAEGLGTCANMFKDEICDPALDAFVQPKNNQSHDLFRQENAKLSMQCLSLRLFAPCAWMLSQSVFLRNRTRIPLLDRCTV